MIPLRDSIVGERTPYLTYALLAANALGFALQLLAPGDAVETVLVEGRSLALSTGFEQAVWRFGLRPAELLDPSLGLPPATPVPEWVTVFTSMFMHGGWLHIGGNMLYLWIFADNVEDALGHGRFLLFYLLAGAAAAGLQTAVHPDSTIPMVGASGAIAGVLGGYVLLYPRARVLTLIPIFFFVRIVEIPAVFFLGFWFLLQLVSAPSGGGTAWFAHIGGFVFGIAAVKLFAWGRRRPRVRHRR